MNTNGVRLVGVVLPGTTLSSSYESMEYADVVLRCGGGGHAVSHKSVLASVSDFLKGLLEANPDSHEIILPDLSQETMVNILSLIYRGEVVVGDEGGIGSVIEGIELLGIRVGEIEVEGLGLGEHLVTKSVDEDGVDVEKQWVESIEEQSNQQYTGSTEGGSNEQWVGSTGDGSNEQWMELTEDGSKSRSNMQLAGSIGEESREVALISHLEDSGPKPRDWYESIQESKEDEVTKQWEWGQSGYQGEDSEDSILFHKGVNGQQIDESRMDETEAALLLGWRSKKVKRVCPYNYIEVRRAQPHLPQPPPEGESLELNRRSTAKDHAYAHSINRSIK